MSFGDSYKLSLELITLGTLIIQFYVIYLIGFHTPANMKNYKYYLILISDILFTVEMGLAVNPYPLPYLAVKASGWCTFFDSEKVCITAVSGAVAAYVSVITTQIHCLMYRTIVLLPNKRIYHLFNSIPTKIFMLNFGFVISGSLAAGFYANCILLEELPMHPYNEDHWTVIKDYVGPTETAIMFDLQSVSTLRYLFISGGLLGFSEIMSFSMVSGILLYLRSRSHLFSKATYKLHVQYTLLLGVQLFTPLILLIVPIAIYVHSLIIQAKLQELYVASGLLVFTTYSFVNGLFTLILIAPYRRRARQQLIDPILKLFCSRSRFFVAQNTTQTTPIQEDTTMSIIPSVAPRTFAVKFPRFCG